MRADALEQLGLAEQDWGPCYASEFSHAQFAAGWRGDKPVPSEAAIAAEITTLQAAHAATQYRRDRVYHPIGDQLDDLFRQGAFSPEMAATLHAVKTAHPKGTL